MNWKNERMVFTTFVSIEFMISWSLYSLKPTAWLSTSKTRFAKLYIRMRYSLALFTRA